MRVRLDKIATRRGRDDRLLIAPNRRVTVYEDDGTTEATGYTTQLGSTEVTYPLEADRNGRYTAWYDPGDYWIEEVANGRQTFWPAVSASDLGGRELGYASITSTFTQTGAGNSDVTGLSVTVTVGTRPINVIFSCASVSNNNASGIAYLKIMEGATLLGNAVISLSAVGQALHRTVRLSPSAGSHTYKVNLQQVVTGNTSLFADSGTTYGPASIQVIEV